MMCTLPDMPPGKTDHVIQNCKPQVGNVVSWLVNDFSCDPDQIVSQMMMRGQVG